MKPCVFSGKVAAAGEKGQLVCVAGAAVRFHVCLVPPWCSEKCGCKSHCNGWEVLCASFLSTK